MDGAAQEVGQLDFELADRIENVVGGDRLERGIAFRHVTFRDGVAGIDLAHVDARVVADRSFREKVQRIETERIDLQREKIGLLHEFDRAQTERLGEPRESWDREPCLAGEDAFDQRNLKPARLGERRGIGVSLSGRNGPQRLTEGAAAGGPRRAVIAYRFKAATITRVHDPPIRAGPGTSFRERNPPAMPYDAATETRKSRHLDICLNDDVASTLDAGFAAVRLRHEALPEIALGDVSLATTFLGRSLRAPLLISSMTGGTERAKEINHNLARAAQSCGIALALGSQRAAIEKEELLASYAVRNVAPDIALFANLGAVQLNYGVTIEDARRAVKGIGADGLYLHLNPLQEALQPHGDTNFRELLPKIAALTKAIGVPVIAKSVGSGIAPSTAARLLEAGIAAIDVAGAGGTSWARVEGKRSADPLRAKLAEEFSDWGWPTARATRALRVALPDATLVASGGVRSGIDVAKALALGADLAGTALPLLEPATRSADAVIETLVEILEGLRIAMFATGSSTVRALRDALV